MNPLALFSFVRPWMVWAVMALATLAILMQGAVRIYSNGFDAGQLHERAVTKEAMDARQREDQRLAGQLAAAARAEAASWRDNAHRLQTENRRARTLLAVAPACGPGAADAAAAGVPLAVDGVSSTRPADGAGQPELPAQLPGHAALWLSADAVRMWDSALAGRPVPAGACGADGTPAGACATATAIELGDAWDNHTENAARCGIDRARHQRLIEFLQARQAGAAAQR